MTMNIRALSLWLLFFTSAAFGQFTLQVPPSPVDVTNPTIVRFRVVGVKAWDEVDDVLVLTAVGSKPIFTDVMESRTPGEWGFFGPAGTYSIRIKIKGSSPLFGGIVLGGTPPVNPPNPPPVVDPKPVDPPVDPPKPPDPKKKVARVTYVYEKDQGSVPRPVSAALQRINREHAGTIVASEFEEDTVNGEGKTPAQFKSALDQARNAGLPALIVEAVDGTILNVVDRPVTEETVMEAIAL